MKQGSEQNNGNNEGSRSVTPSTSSSGGHHEVDERSDVSSYNTEASVGDFQRGNNDHYNSNNTGGGEVVPDSVMSITRLSVQAGGGLLQPRDDPNEGSDWMLGDAFIFPFFDQRGGGGYYHQREIMEILEEVLDITSNEESLFDTASN